MATIKREVKIDLKEAIGEYLKHKKKGEVIVKSGNTLGGFQLWAREEHRVVYSPAELGLALTALVREGKLEISCSQEGSYLHVTFSCTGV